MCIRVYMMIWISRCVLMFMIIEKATASAADLWDPSNGCLDAWMLVFVLARLQMWPQFGLLFGGLWSPVVSFGMVPASLWEHVGSTGSARIPR